MSDKSVGVMERDEIDVSQEFGIDEFHQNAKDYRTWKTVANAIARLIKRKDSAINNIDDALSQIADLWARLDDQYERGVGYTPPASFGARGVNAREIAGAIIGRGPSTSELKNAFSDFGA